MHGARAMSPAAVRWAAVVEEMERSGLSARAFARRHGFNPSTLAWWRWRLRQAEPSSGSGFVELHVMPEPPADPAAPRVVALRLTSPGKPWVLEVPSDLDPRVLRDLVDALC